MVALVTLDKVKMALRIGDIEEASGDQWTVAPHEDDVILQTYIAAASQAIIRYLDTRAEAVLDLDSGGEIPSGVEVPADVQLAAIMLVGQFYREPDADADKAFEMGYLPKPVMALLYPLKDPTLA